jgi:hypothetical protein
MAKFIVYSLRMGTRQMRGYFTPTWTTESVYEPPIDGSTIPVTVDFFDGTMGAMPTDKVFVADCFYHALCRCWPTHTNRGLFVHLAQSSTSTQKVYIYSGLYYVVQQVAP